MVRMITLSEFLLARIAEDERRAGLLQSEIVYLEGPEEAENAAHTLLDPARILAECEAKRKVIALHNTRFTLAGPDGRKGVRCVACKDLTSPCKTLRTLGEPYSAHEEYREEWQA